MAVSGVSQTRSHLNAYEHLTLIGKSNALCPPLPLLPYYHPHRRSPVLFLLHPFVGVKYSSKSPVMPAAVSNFFRFLSRARAGSRARARARARTSSYYFRDTHFQRRPLSRVFYCRIIRVHRDFYRSSLPPIDT